MQYVSLKFAGILLAWNAFIEQKIDKRTVEVIPIKRQSSMLQNLYRQFSVDDTIYLILNRITALTVIEILMTK